jgi:biopolymer transport protein ExbB
MIDLIAKGGPVMIPIILLSIVALAIILERLWRLWRIRLNISQFAEEIFLYLERGHLQKAVERCRKARHPVADLFQVGILNRNLRREELEKLMEPEGEEQIHELERYLGGLIVIIGVEPMLGFLGTITGLIRAFMTWEKLGSNITVNALAAGIYEAMITTAAGLIVAIPYYVIYHLIVGRIKGYAREMSYYGNELLDVLARVKDAGVKEVAIR